MTYTRLRWMTRTLARFLRLMVAVVAFFAFAAFFLLFFTSLHRRPGLGCCTLLCAVCSAVHCTCSCSCLLRSGV
jgi:hypothetical protein